jgi:glucose-6-phosphate 1-dehydrogenase
VTALDPTAPAGDGPLPFPDGVTSREVRSPVDVASSLPVRSAPLGREVHPHVIVLFGATGDLARRKLLPGLFRLDRAGMLPDTRIVGTSMEDLTDDDVRAMALDACRDVVRDGVDPEAWAAFSAKLGYVPLSAHPSGLVERVRDMEAQLEGECRLLHYLSVPPAAAPEVVRMLGASGLHHGARIVMEKPFGFDLATSRALNATVDEIFEPDQVFRIDHFLGKEAALNILAFRFANGLFEPIWNRQMIDHVQIDVPETLSVGSRGPTYDSSGAFRDMVVTHLFQILAFVAMEPPTALAPDAINEEKDKVFRSMLPLDVEHVVRGQYEGYRDTPGVADDSETKTFVALRCEIDNWRWAGVPFYLRTGKEMAEGARIVSIAFKEPPPDHLTFDLSDSQPFDALRRVLHSHSRCAAHPTRKGTPRSRAGRRRGIADMGRSASGRLGGRDSGRSPGMSQASTDRIEVARTIRAEPSAVFAVLCDPDGHVAIDSSGMLMSAEGDVVTGVDDTFVVHMDREALNDFPLGEYDVTIRIVRFEPDREIAWTVEGQLDIGHVYGYRLEPGEEPGTTIATSYYDWSTISPEWREAGIFPVISEGALRATLGILARTVQRS